MRPVSPFDLMNEMTALRDAKFVVTPVAMRARVNGQSLE